MNKDSIRLGLKTLKVKCFDRYVGTLAMTPDGKVAFSYDDEWLVNGFAISPFSLPLEKMENMFRRACFNVFAHNRDDHAKNFTFLYNEDEDCWRLSPAYDITYSNTYYGEHTTSVDGNGKNPGEKELMNVGTGAGIKKSLCEDIIDEIRTIVGEELAFIKKDN